LIASREELEQLVEEIRRSDRVALDTEADSLHCYFEKLCLLQIGLGEGRNLLVDPLADLELQPLLDAMTSRKMVLHGADYDLRLLREFGRFEPVELFDTSIAARLLGRKGLGLAALVEHAFGVKLCKASQKANWGLRPLSPRMVEYALNDVRYLLEIAARLEEELRALDRLSWLEESCQRLVDVARKDGEKDPEKVWRITGTAALDDRGAAIARELWFWRDQEAREWDRPPFHVMSNQNIVTIAANLSAGKAFSTPQFGKSRTKRFEQLIAKALALPKSEWPKTKKHKRRKPSKEELKRFDELKSRRDKAAKTLDLEPSVIASKGLLEAASTEPETTRLMNWQRGLLGLDLPTEVALPDHTG